MVGKGTMNALSGFSQKKTLLPNPSRKYRALKVLWDKKKYTAQCGDAL